MRGYPTPNGFTRGRLLRAALGGGAVAAGAAAIGARSGGGTSLAAQSKGQTDILNVFLLLEQVQERFYRAALEAGRLDGELRKFAEVVGRQDEEHVAFLTERLGSRAGEPPRSEFGDALSSPERFRETAIDLEEATIAVYVGQGANLSRENIRTVATLVAVEARQAAWIRDLAGVSPAPRAADPARKADEVVAELRKRGFVA